MSWLAQELSWATGNQRKVVLLLHAHKELYLQYDPTFIGLLQGSNVVAIFYGHIHIKPWGYVGVYKNTTIPMFNCGASWYSVFCLAEFSEDRFRVGSVVHYGDGQPRWWGGLTVHAHRGMQRAKPVLQMLVPNPVVDVPHSGSLGLGSSIVRHMMVWWGLLLALVGLSLS